MSSMDPVQIYEEDIPTDPENPRHEHPRHELCSTIHLQSAFATPAQTNESDERRSNASLLSFARWLAKSNGHQERHEERIAYTTQHKGNRLCRVVDYSDKRPVDVLVISVSGGPKH